MGEGLGRIVARCNEVEVHVTPWLVHGLIVMRAEIVVSAGYEPVHGIRGAVRSADHGHLLDTTARGRTCETAVVPPLLNVVELFHVVEEGNNEGLQVGIILPNEAVAMDVALGVAREIANSSVVGCCVANVSVVLHPLAVVLGPTTHVGVVLAVSVDKI